MILGTWRSRDWTNVSVVVDDLAAAIAFFTALGMTLEGEMPAFSPTCAAVLLGALSPHP